MTQHSTRNADYETIFADVAEDLFEAFRPTREMSEMAARAVAAGVPVKVRKGVEYLYVNDATYNYLAGPRAIIEVPIVCSCSQRPYPHELSVHRGTRFEQPGSYGVYDGKAHEDVRIHFAGDEMRWPWSLRFLENGGEM